MHLPPWVSARATGLTINAASLNSIDPATAQTMMLAALIVMVQGGSTVLVNPQAPVLKMLTRTRTTETFAIQSRTPAETAPDASAPDEREKETRANG